LPSAAAIIERQTGNRLDLSALPQAVLEQPSAVALDEFSFWKAIEELTKPFGVRIGGQTGDGRLQLVPADGDIPAAVGVANSGAFRIVIESAQRRPLFGNERQQLLRLRVSLMAEPRLRPLFLKFSAADLTVR